MQHLNLALGYDYANGYLPVVKRIQFHPILCSFGCLWCGVQSHSILCRGWLQWSTHRAIPGTSCLRIVPTWWGVFLSDAFGVLVANGHQSTLEVTGCAGFGQC